MEQKDLEKLVIDTRQDVISIKAQQKEIYDALVGNKMGSIGLVEQVVDNKHDISVVKEKLELHIKSQDERKNKIRGGIAVLAFLWSFMMWAIGHFL